MAAQVASPSSPDTLGRRSTSNAAAPALPSSVSRKSILASMESSTAASEDQVISPVSNTDALLRSRSTRPSSTHSNSNGNGNGSSILASPSKQHKRKTSVGQANTRSTILQATSPILSPKSTSDNDDKNALNVPNSNALRHSPSNISSRSKNNEDDRQSISSRRSSRGVLSSIMRRGSRSQSTEPDSDSYSNYNGGGGGASRPSSIRSSRRMSLRMPSFKKGGNAREEDDVPPPVPAVPTDRSKSYSRKNVNATSNGNGNAANGTTSPASTSPNPEDARMRSYSKLINGNGNSNGGASEGLPPSSRGYSAPPSSQPAATSQKQEELKPKQQQQQQQQANGTSSSNGILGSTAAIVAGGAAAAGGAVASITGLGSKKEDESTSNGYGAYDSDEESDEFHDAELADIAEGTEDEDESPQQQPTRHRGLSDGAVLGSNIPRSSSPETTTTNTTTNDNGTSRTNSQIGSTASYKRRSGSVPTGAASSESSSTPNDNKAKKETPQHVREKAARVAKLNFDDVKQSGEEMIEDIGVARKALHLFLNSHMIEAEKIIEVHADKRMYYALGWGLIATIKGFMTFEPADLATAISFCKDSLTIANHLRKPSSSVANFGRFVRGTGVSPQGMANMTLVQRHAELVYAESLLLKAVMGILYSGDFFAFVSEALNMRNAYGIYRSLSKYVEWADAKKAGTHRDTSIDEDFRSGVYLGNGLISMILGLLPGKVLKIMEVIGYTGDTEWALRTLARAGGWSSDPKKLEPKMPIQDEGIRRQVCDMGILLYHLVISTFIPVTGVDVDYADKVLHYNLERYPQGVFFLYFSGRLYSTQALSEKAVRQFTSARDVQEEYVQLKHICYWDMSLCHMSLCQWTEAYNCFNLLREESNWSKAVYSYGKAANLYQSGNIDGAADLFSAVPDLMQRIAGKSIPMEKFVARKAKKFVQQRRLLLPGIEFSYIYHCMATAPRFTLADEQLVLVSDALAELHEVEDPSQYHSGADEYWDDFCLAHFLRGVVLRFIAFPEPHAKVRPTESPIPVEEAAEQARISFTNVIQNANNISYDHYLIYFSHYELGRLHANLGEDDQARAEYNLVLSGKTLEDKGRKGKYGMQNMCHLRSNGALQTLNAKKQR